MNICIVTVYNTHNCGSFLQAVALSKVLKDNGHNVFFLKRELSDTPNTLASHRNIAIKKALKLKFDVAKNELITQKAYDAAQKIFDEIDINSSKINDIDYFVFGSDTIWNIKDNYFKSKIDTFFGKSINGKKIAYAPSIGGSDIEDFNTNEIKSALKDFCVLSARDENTKQMIKEMTSIDSSIVCDPTLLLTKEDYNSLIDDKKALKNAPIFIYHFDSISQNNIKAIKEFAKRTGKKTVSMGRDCSWTDEVLPSDPYLFLQCFRDSSYVITNTYHGTIFSLIYQKDFACLGKSKAKVAHIIDMVGANDIMIDKSEDISPIFDKKIDYKNIDTILNNIKTESLSFLKDSTNEK